MDIAKPPSSAVNGQPKRKPVPDSVLLLTRGAEVSILEQRSAQRVAARKREYGLGGLNAEMDAIRPSQFQKRNRIGVLMAGEEAAFFNVLDRESKLLRRLKETHREKLVLMMDADAPQLP